MYNIIYNSEGKKYMKRMIILLCCFILAAGISGCSKSKTANTQTKNKVGNVENYQKEKKIEDKIGSYIIGNDEWTAFGYETGIEIKKNNRDGEFKFESPKGYVSEKILATEDGFYYGRDDAMRYFENETESEVVITSGWCNASPVAVIENNLYFTASEELDAGMRFFVEVNLKSNDIRRFELPNVGSDTVVCNGNIYYVEKRYELKPVSLYKINIEKGTAEKVESMITGKLITDKNKIYYCIASENDLIDNDTQVSAMERDTKSGKTKSLASGRYDEIGEPVAISGSLIYFITDNYTNDKIYKSGIEQWEPVIIKEGERMTYLGLGTQTVYVSETGSNYNDFTIISCNTETGEERCSEKIEGSLLGIYKNLYYVKEYDKNGEPRYRFTQMGFLQK